MKKLIAIAAVALMISETASAQELTNATKAAAGTITVEGQFSLWGPTQVVAPLIRGRYFITDDLAARLQLGFFTNNSTTNFAENPDGSGGKGSNVRTNTYFDLRLGVEKHLGSHEKFSPYLGAEFMFGSGSAKESWTNSNNGNSYTLNDSRTINGNWQGGGLMYNPGTTLGFNLILGADYYVFQQLYVGAEFGYGFMTNNQPDVVIEQSVGGVTTKTTQLGGSRNGLGMYNMNGGMRIGIRF
jgi:hypothetical protein